MGFLEDATGTLVPRPRAQEAPAAAAGRAWRGAASRGKVAFVPPPSPPLHPGGPPGRGERILIVKLSALGDVAHALPVLVGLRRERPGAEIDWVVEDRAAALLAHRPEIARVILFPRREILARRGRPFAAAGRLARFAADLRSRPYDAALDLQGNLKSGWITRLSGARERVGFAPPHGREANHLFTNHRVRIPAAARHRVERNLALLSGWLGRKVAWADPGLPAPAEAEAEAGRLLGAAGLPARGLVLLHPGTSRFGAFKRWPPERFGDLARTLAERGEVVLVLAPPGEEPLAARAAAASRGAARALAVGDLDVLVALLGRARLFVGADSGPLHLAALAGVPCLGLYGPKDPAVYGPYGRRRDGSVGLLPLVTRSDVACRPCRLRRCADPVCLTGLEPEQAFAALLAAGLLPTEGRA